MGIRFSIVGAIILLSLGLFMSEVFAAPVVVELFTGRACAPSQKVKDDLAATMPDETLNMDNTILLSCNVSSFNFEWLYNPLAMPDCNRRLQFYAGTLSIRPGQTPNMVIGGQYETVGDNAALVQAGVRMIHSSFAPPRSLQVSLNPNGEKGAALQIAHDFTKEQASVHTHQTLWIIAYRHTPMSMPGQTMPIYETLWIDQWSVPSGYQPFPPPYADQEIKAFAATQEHSLPIQRTTEDTGYVVMLQENNSAKILAQGHLRL